MSDLKNLPDFILSGYIYILQLKDLPIYKIGSSSNPLARIKNIQNSIPLEYIPVQILLSNDVGRDEHALHDLFKDKKINIPNFKKQEWFRLTKLDIQFFTNGCTICTPKPDDEDFVGWINWRKRCNEELENIISQLRKKDDQRRSII